MGSTHTRPVEPTPDKGTVATIPAPPCSTRTRALYSYEGHDSTELSFQTHEILYILNKDKDPWWLAMHGINSSVGLIPSNYVINDDGSPTSLDAWRDINRREAERMLMLMGNPSGTYIVRPSADGNFALSVRSNDAGRNLWAVRNYRIKVMPTESKTLFCISKDKEFSNIQELISHYQQNPIVNSLKLTQACSRNYRPPVQFRDLEVSRQSINMIRRLGNGSFGEVWLGKWGKSLEVAIKQLLRNTMNRERFIQEAEVMHKLHHPRIVQILGVCTEPRDAPVYIITELMAKGALLDFIKSADGKATLKFSGMMDMLCQVTEGMAYLEEKNFIHRDLRAANILVDDSLSVKVADFGLAQVTHDDIYTGSQDTKFPVKWTAPEAARGDHIFSVKSDVWSLGVLIYEILTYGLSPYPNMANNRVLDAIISGYRLPNPQREGFECPDQLYSLMNNCWNIHPENRPTFRSLNEVFADWVVALEKEYDGRKD